MGRPNIVHNLSIRINILIHLQRPNIGLVSTALITSVHILDIPIIPGVLFELEFHPLAIPIIVIYWLIRVLILLPLLMLSSMILVITLIFGSWYFIS